jgi:hypothetical protein
MIAKPTVLFVVACALFTFLAVGASAGSADDAWLRQKMDFETKIDDYTYMCGLVKDVKSGRFAMTDAEIENNTPGIIQKCGLEFERLKLEYTRFLARGLPR